MSSSREQMMRLLQDAKATVRARIPEAPRGGAHRHGRPHPNAGGHKEKDGEAKSATATTAAETGDTAETVTNKLDAKEHMMEFLHLYYQILRGFVLDPTKFKLPLEGLDGNARRVLHLLAERCNLDHHSGGTGDERAIMIEKGPLFYQHQEAYQTVDLERLAQEVNSKTSKFELKRAARLKDEDMTSGVIGSYDEEAYRKVLRFQRSTDEYRHAVDIGYSQEDLQRHEGGGGGDADDTTAARDGDGSARVPSPLSVPGSSRRLEELLSRPAAGADDDVAAQDVVGAVRRTGGATPPPTTTTTATASSAKSAATANRTSASASASATTPQKTTTYEETCRGCWARIPLQTSLKDWRCSKYCAQCGKDTIWMLRPITEPTPSATTTTAGSDTAGGTATAGGADAATGEKGSAKSKGEKRQREDGDDAASSCSASEADADDGDENDEPLHIEDVVEMANGNDLEATDVNWVRQFCGRHADHLQRNVVFCIDLHDLLELPVFQRPAREARRAQRRQDAKRARHESNPDGGAVADSAAVTTAVRVPQYVVVRENKAVHAGLASLLEKVMQTAFTCTPAAESAAVPSETAALHAALALPNASVYGTEAVAIVQLRPSESETLVVNATGLAELEREFGARHVHLFQDLEEAIKAAE